ncbi:hypothetical protein [Singulisphaera sp. PoT]|uniref:hypothetical protein n=1 Tax=Singulisphaera sp. PoT TaxID=3411797 RepID=UPI003BF48A0B
MVEPIVIMERENGVDAMKRSKQLASAYKLQIFGAIVFLAVLNILVSALMQYVLLFLSTRSNAFQPTIAIMYSFSNCVMRVVTTLQAILPLVIYQESYNLHGPAIHVSEWFLDKKVAGEES